MRELGRVERYMDRQGMGILEWKWMGVGSGEGSENR